MVVHNMHINFHFIYFTGKGVVRAIVFFFFLRFKINITKFRYPERKFRISVECKGFNFMEVKGDGPDKTPYGF